MHFSARDCARNFVYIISVRFIGRLIESTNTRYMQQSRTGCRQPSGLCLEVCGQIPSTFYGISIWRPHPPVPAQTFRNWALLSAGTHPFTFRAFTLCVLAETKVTTPTAHIHNPNQTSCKERTESEQQLIFIDSNEEEEGQRQGEALLWPD